MKTSSVALLLLASGCFGGGSYSPVQTAFNRGVYLASVGELEAALTEYRDALRIDADDYRARFNLASTLEDLADRDEVGGALERAAERRRSARAQYETLLRRKPGELRASINLALREHADGESQQGRERLRAAAEQHPDDPRPVAAQARLHWVDGRLDEAERLLRTALEREPTDLTTNMLLGDLLKQRGALDDARAAYAAALRRNEAEVAVLFALGDLECQAERWGEARIWFERVLLIDPDHHASRLALADALEQAGDLDGAALQRLTVKTLRR